MEEAEQYRIRLLGRKGEMNDLFEEFKKVEPGLKKDIGQALNQLKTAVQEAIQKAKDECGAKASAQAASELDLSRPVDERIGHRHPLSQVREEIFRIFGKIGYTVGMDKSIIERLTRLTEEEREILAGQALRRGDYTLSDKFIVNEKKLLGEGKQLDLRLHTRFVDFPEHGHDYMEFMYVYAGSVTHVIDGKRIPLACGDILFLNRHIRHSVLKAGQEDIGINFIVSNDFLKQVFRNVRNDPIMSGFLMRNFEQDGEGEYLHFRTREVFPVRNLLDNLIYALAEEGAADDAVLTQLVSLLFTYLAKYSATLAEGYRAASPEIRLRQQISAYLEENYPRATLTDLAERTGYSLEYLSRRIRELFGSSFRGLLIDRRLAAAEQLLLSTDMNVEEVVRAVGYENQSHFHRMFRQRTGKTPRRFRLDK